MAMRGCANWVLIWVLLCLVSPNAVAHAVAEQAELGTSTERWMWSASFNEKMNGYWRSAADGALMGLFASMAGMLLQDAQPQTRGIGVSVGLVSGLLVGVITELIKFRSHVFTHLSGRFNMHDFYGTECPFSKWFPRVEVRTETWERRLTRRFKDKVNQFGSISLTTQADTNVNAFYGQGKTTAFVPGFFTPSPASPALPPDLKVGLFAGNAPIRLVARISSWERTDEEGVSFVPVVRMALKMPFPKHLVAQCEGEEVDYGAWGKEVNLLFSEGMSEFPIGGYRELEQSVNIPNGDVMLVNSPHEILAMAESTNNHIHRKRFYTQVPFGLGCNMAAKFYLEPQAPAQCSVNRLESIEPTHWTQALRELGRTRGGACRLRWSLHAVIIPIEDNEILIDMEANKQWNMADVPVQLGVVSLRITDGENRLNPPQFRSTPAQRDSKSFLDKSLIETLASSHDPALLAKIQNPMMLSVLASVYMFHPFMTSEAHKPLGQINAFRAHYYPRHARNRYELFVKKGIITLQSELASRIVADQINRPHVVSDPSGDTQRSDPSGDTQRSDQAQSNVPFLTTRSYPLSVPEAFWTNDLFWDAFAP